MTTAKRPLKPEAFGPADDDFYAAHEGDRPRPNDVFDADGNRKKLDATDPCQKDLRDEWLKYYEKHGGEIEDPEKPPHAPPNTPVVPCPKTDELMLVELIERRTHYVEDPDSKYGSLKITEISQTPSSDRRQYVNLTSNHLRPHFDHSRTIELKARVKWKSGKDVDLAGHPVTFQVEPDASNRVNLLTELRHDEAGTTAATDAEGWTSIAKINLSIYGGDKFRICATLGAGRADDKRTGEFTIWRKVYCEVETMRASNGGLRPNLFESDRTISELKSDFVELVLIGEDSHPPYKRVMEYEKASSQNYVASLRDTEAKYIPYIRYVFCDLVTDFEGSVRKRRWVPKSGSFNLTTGSTTLDPDGCVIQASWKHVGGQWAHFPSYHLRFEERDTRRESFRVHVTTAGVAGLDPKRRVKLDVELRTLECLGGFQDLETVFIATRWIKQKKAGGFVERERSITSDILHHICIHEVGHAWGIPANTTPDGEKNLYNPSETHCVYHGGDCVMFSTVAGSTSDSYCPICSDCFRGRNLSELPRASADSY